MIDLADEDVSSRIVQWLLAGPISDGGQVRSARPSRCVLTRNCLGVLVRCHQPSHIAHAHHPRSLLAPPQWSMFTSLINRYGECEHCSSGDNAGIVSALLTRLCT